MQGGESESLWSDSLLILVQVISRGRRFGEGERKLTKGTERLAVWGRDSEVKKRVRKAANSVRFDSEKWKQWLLIFDLLQ